MEDGYNFLIPSSSERSFRHARYGTGKLADAPSPKHDLPEGDITLAEIAAFLPQSIKSWDVTDRIIWNGAASEDLAIMFNRYRNLSSKIDINSVYLMFRGQMCQHTEAEYRYKNWKKWIVSAQGAVQKPDGFDPDSISVTGFRRPVVFQNRPDVLANAVPFTDLARGVAVWPEGYDALDLTRCIRWCVDHPETEFYYPNDYRTVLYECVDGPLGSDPRHSDAHALARLRPATGRTAPRRRTNRDYSYSNVNSEAEGNGAKLGKRKCGESHHVQRSKRYKGTTPAHAWQDRTTCSTTARPPAKKFAHLEIESNMDTDNDVYQGPKRTNKNEDASRRSRRKKIKTIALVDVDRADVNGVGEEDKWEED